MAIVQWGVRAEDEIVWYWIGSHADYERLLSQRRRRPYPNFHNWRGEAMNSGAEPEAKSLKSFAVGLQTRV